MREKAESSSSTLQKFWLIASKQLVSLKASYEEERTTLLKNVEEVEGRLEPVTEELNVLKRHITNMIVAIFGK